LAIPQEVRAQVIWSALGFSADANISDARRLADVVVKRLGTRWQVKTVSAGADEDLPRQVSQHIKSEPALLVPHLTIFWLPDSRRW
jgi:hypothetical protein